MNNKLTVRILIFMLVGAVFGVLAKFALAAGIFGFGFINNLLVLGGNLFLSLIQMLVIPIVMVSIICGICSLERIGALKQISFKAFLWFIVTTFIAVVIAAFAAWFFNVGANINLEAASKLDFIKNTPPSLWSFVNDIIPVNPFKAMAEGNMLQIIVLSLLFGIAVNLSGDHGKRIAGFFRDINEILMKYIMVLMKAAPYGVFCLIAALFIEQGFELVLGMLNYFLLVIVVLIFHVVVVYSGILSFAKFSPKVFFRKVYSVMLFAFGVSSSAASIPVMLDTTEKRLGVSDTVSSFVIPLGVNFNKNGTAIMQVIATIFIAHVYNIPFGFAEYAILIFMAILVSISTAAIPGIGLITLVIILNQLGLPVEGISLIVGIDRLIDMVRTAINAAGNMMIACLVGKSEKQIDYRVFNNNL